MALGGMQDVGQNGPENEVNPLIDNGFMYTTDGWGTVYKIDARDADRGKFVWVADAGVQHEGNPPRTRGIALWEDRVLANLPDGRVIAINRDNGEIVWDKKRRRRRTSSAARSAFYTAPIVADGKVIVQNGAGDGGTRGWIAASTRRPATRMWRFYTVPKPGDPGQRNLEGRSQRLEDRRRRHLADRLVRSGARKLYIVGTGNPYPIYDPQFRPGDNLYTNSVDRHQRRHRQARLALPVHAERLVGLRRGRRPHAVRHEIDGVMRKVVGHYGRNGFYYTLDRTNGKFIKVGEVRERPELDEGHRSRRPASRSSTTRSSTCRSTTPKRGRCAATARSAPARRGMAASRTSRWPSTR